MTDEQIKANILAYFSGKLSPEDEEKLLLWIKEDNENLDYFNHVKYNIDIESVSHPLTQTSFAELKNKIFIQQQFTSTQATIGHKFYLSFSKIAAIFFFAILLGAVSTYLINRSTASKQVVWFETKVPRGKKSQLLLPDGSKIWVNAETSISYPNNFMNGNRIIKLDGEAYFEVAKLNGSNFTVETNDYNIHVLGTKFNVTAYSDFGRTETSLIEGRVEIDKDAQTVNIIPGQTVTFCNDKFKVKSNNTLQTSKWKDDVFDFDHVAFKELIKRLERWYDVEIDIKSPELSDIVYSGVFKNEETIDEVLNIFELTLPVSYSRESFRKFSIHLKK